MTEQTAAPAAPPPLAHAAPKAPPLERQRDAASGKYVSLEKSNLNERREAAREKMRAALGVTAGPGRLQALGVNPVEAPKPKEEVQAPEAEAQAAAPEAKPEPQEDVDAEAVEAGVAALKRFKVPAKLIESMSKADLAVYGAEAARELAAKAELSRELGELRKAAKPAAPVKAASAPAEHPAFDLDAELKGLDGSLDEEAVKGLGKILKAMRSENDALRADLKSAHERFESELTPFKAERNVALFEKAKAGLIERFDWSDGQAADEKVALRMKWLNRPDEDGKRPYTDMDKLAYDAARWELAPKTAKPATPAPKSRTRDDSLAANANRLRPVAPTKRDLVRLALQHADLPQKELNAKVRDAAS